jgi:hypothetical protein
LWKIYATYGWGLIVVVGSNPYLCVASIELRLNDPTSRFDPFFLPSSRSEIIEFTLGVED